MIRCRVVCGLSETMLTLRPQIVLTSDDLPTFGRPTKATKPERMSDIGVAIRSQRSAQPVDDGRLLRLDDRVDGEQIGHAVFVARTAFTT